MDSQIPKSQDIPEKAPDPPPPLEIWQSHLADMRSTRQPSKNSSRNCSRNPWENPLENPLENLVDSSCRYEKHPSALSLHKTKESLQLWANIALLQLYIYTALQLFINLWKSHWVNICVGCYIQWSTSNKNGWLIHLCIVGSPPVGCYVLQTNPLFHL